MKKHLSGFVPIKFNNAGKILLTVGFICLVAKLASYFTQFTLPNNFLFFGISLIILALYLNFVVGKK